VAAVVMKRLAKKAHEAHLFIVSTNIYMRRSAFSAGRPGALIREITWKGNMRVSEFHTQNEAIDTLQLVDNALMSK
ncbi:MAG: hypothetical protein K2O16_09265, partial [Lachnospiraceae bacterium]|nr:hypothetical protein [Lachnospiraceae bacterium]